MKPKTSKILLIVSLFVLALSLFACDSIQTPTETNPPTNQETEPSNQTTPVDVYVLSLDKDNVTLEIGDTDTVTASLLKNGVACDDAVEWVSEDPTIATVENGVITALSAGQTVVKASSNGQECQVSVTVNEEASDVFLLLNYESKELKVNDTLALIATLTDGQTPELAYSSSDESIATIDSNGVVTAVKAGNATITVKAYEGTEDELVATCNLTITSAIQLVFPAISGHDYFVGETIDLGVFIIVDGETKYEGVEISGDKFTVEGDVITLTDDGEITITVSYVGQEDLVQKIVAYNKIETADDFANMNNDLNGYYRLANDIDLKGGILTTVAHYNDNGCETKDNGFNGVFDGNSYSIKNYANVLGSKGTANNSSPFGTIGATGIVRNVNFINGVILNRIVGGVATINHGTIENCYVEVLDKHVFTKAETNNPIGGIVSKNYAMVKNCVAVLHVADEVFDGEFGTDYLGGIVGRNSSAAAVINDCYALTTFGVLSQAKASENATSIKNTQTVPTLAELNALIAGNESFDKTLWKVAEGKYPYVGSMDNIEVTAENLEVEVYAGSSTTVSASCTLPVYYQLANAVDGVTLNEKTGEISVSKDMVGAEIAVIAYNNYNASSITITVKVSEAPAVVDTTNYQPISFDVILGNDEMVKAHNIVVTIAGETYTGSDLTFESSNASVATADITNVTAVNDGVATINLLYKGNIIHTFDVTVIAYNPVYTIAEFESINTSAETRGLKYKLMNDLDYQGNNLKTIAHWNADNCQSATNGFSGIFDGQGYTIMNYAAVVTKANELTSNCSPFGTVAKTGVIRNVNFINGVIANRIAGGIATINYGSIENCYVDVLVTHNPSASGDANNPIGGIVSKNYGTIKNCAAILNLAENVTSVANIGGIMGTNASASAFTPLVPINVTSSYALTDLGVYASAKSSLELNESSLVNSSTVKTLAELNTLITNDATYDKTLWQVAEGKYPHLGSVANLDIKAEKAELEVFEDGSITVKAVSSLPICYKLATEIAGVTVDALTGLVTVSGVEADTEITVIAYNNYNDATATIVVKVIEIPIEIDTTNYQALSFDGIVGTDAMTLAHNIVVKLAGEAYTGSDLTFVSSNESIATANVTSVTALDDGVATIQIAYKGNAIYSFDVNVVAYHPITTIAEFEAINTSDATRAKKYVLMNDLDYEGKAVDTIAHYSDKNDAGKADGNARFYGSFDGQGYAIKNYVTGTANGSVFGTIGDTGVVKNVNFINGKLTQRITGGVATINRGTIENCYVEVLDAHVFTKEETNNPIGGIVSKNYATVKNCVVVLTISDDVVNGTYGTKYLGGIVGMNSDSKAVMSNCYALTTVDILSSVKLTTNVAGVTSCSTVPTLAELNTLITNDTTFDKTNVWNVVEGQNPSVK